jgi:hypothetical protein
MPRKKRKPKSEPVQDIDEGDINNNNKPKAGMGATPAAHELATSQLDSDDDDYSKKKEPSLQQDAELRKERKRLYELQESKRRLRQEETRSKKTVDGETPLLRKVKRLKTERNALLQEYNETGGTMKKKNNKKKKRSAGIPLPKK